MVGTDGHADAAPGLPHCPDLSYFRVVAGGRLADITHSFRRLPRSERRFRMLEADVRRSSRCAELAVLVDLEARWENLRACRKSSGPSTLQELQGNQRAYEVFHAKL